MDICSLGSLKRLKVLNLSDNRYFFNHLPNVVGELTYLEELDLHNCNLTELPPRYNMCVCKLYQFEQLACIMFALAAIDTLAFI